MGDRLERCAVASLMSLLNALPHRAAVATGAALGRLLWLLSWKKVDLCERRCVSALGVGVTNARKIIRESYANIGRSAAEFVRLSKLEPRLQDLVTIEGAEHLDEALSRGRGVLLMTAHIDNWELAGARMVQAGYRIVPIYTPQRNTGGINDLIQHQRTDIAGMEMIPSEGGGLREIFRALRSNGVLAVLQDLDARADGVTVPFLGLPASAHVGIVKLHRKFGSPVVPIHFVRGPDPTRHKIIIQEILSDKLDKNGEPFGVNLENSLVMCNNVLEEWIHANPEQWLWLLDRWESMIPVSR